MQPKRLLALSLCRELISISITRRTDASIEDEKYNHAQRPKEPMDTVPSASNDSKLPSSRSDFVNDRLLPRMSSYRCSKQCHRKERNKDEKLHSSFLRYWRRSMILAPKCSSRMSSCRCINVSMTVEDDALEWTMVCQLAARSPRHEEFLVISTVNNLFREKLDYGTYCLPDKSPHYDDEFASSVTKWAKCLQVQMRSNILDSFDLI